MVDQAIPLVPQDPAAPDQTIPFTPPGTVLPPKVAEQRAQTYAFATNGQDDPATIYQQLVAGDEQQYRETVARREAVNADRQKLGIMQDYAQARAASGMTGPLTQTETDTIQGLTMAQLRDPNTILEQLYASQAVKTLYPEGGVRGAAHAAETNTAHTIQDVAEENMAMNVYASKLLEDLNAKWGTKGLGGQSLDVVGQMLPFVSQWNKHGVVTDAKVSTYWTGKSNIEQYAYIRSLPFEQGAKALRQGIEELAGNNALDAAQFLAGFMHYGTSDAFLDTVIDVSDVLSVVAPVVGFARRVGTEAAQAARFGKTAPEIAKMNAKDYAEFVAQRKVVTTQYDKDLASLKEAAKGGGESDPIFKQQLAEIKARRDAGLSELDQIKHEHLQELGQSLKDTIKATGLPGEQDVSNIAAASGRADIAAVDHNFKEAQNALKADDPSHGASRLGASLPSVWDPGKAFREPFKLARRYAQNIFEQMQKNSAAFFKAASGGLGPSMISPEALVEAVKLGRKALIEEMDRAGLADSVIDVNRVINPEDNVGNVAWNVMRLGRPGGEPFLNPAQAKAWLSEYGIKDARVAQQGQSWYIEVVRPVRETETDIKHFLVETNNTTPQSTLTTFLGDHGAIGVRTPNERLSKEQQGIRESVLNRIAEVQRLVSETWKPINALSKVERRNVTRFFDMMRRHEWRDPSGEPIKGIEFTSQSDFETEWLNTFQRLPSGKESMAYWSYIQAHDMELYINDLRLWSGKARQGIQQWQTVPRGPWEEGKLLKEFDWETLTPGANIQVIDANGTKTYQTVHWQKNKQLQAELDFKVKEEGYQIIQSADPRRPVGVPVHFTITKTAKQKNLDFNQIPRKPGGHIRYDYPGFIKQAIISRGGDGYLYHHGDNTVLPITAGIDGKQRVAFLEKARELYVKGDRAGFDAHVNSGPPFSSESLWNKFANGTLDKETPFVYVRSGEGTFHTAEMAKIIGNDKLAIEWSQSPLNLLKGLGREFTGKRGWDVQGIRQIADEETPLFEFVKPRLVDPLPMLGQALSHSIRNKFFEAYQIRSAEHFVEEFHSVLQKGLEPAELARLRENPMRALHNPKWDANASDRKLLAAARGYQDAALNLIGTSTDSGRFTNWVEAKLLDLAFNKGGAKAADFVYEKVLPKISNPVGFARQVAFHTKLGLFNPVQLLVQAQTFSLAVGIAGFKHGGAGVSGAILARMLHVADKPENIKHFAGMASKLGWKAQHFEEAYDQMIQSGIFNIGSQHAWRSDAANVGFYQSKWGKWLDKATIFFQEGERFNHLVGYLSAYHEWRGANPFGKVTRDVQESIMRRYGDMTANMSHASSSSLNRGLGAVAGQFFSYQERLAELMLGKRLTAKEKIRTFAVFSALFGVPTATGAFTLGAEQPIMQGLGAMGVPIPDALRNGSFYEDLRAEGLKRGITNNAYWDSLVEGLPALMLHAALGEQYNVGQRLGPAGLPLWDDIASGVNPIALGMGASGNILTDIFRTARPMLMNVVDALHGKGVSPTTIPDALDLFSNASIMNSGVRAFYAISLGQYLSANKQIIDDKVTGTEAVMMGLLGLTPDRINDRLIMDQAIQARSDAQAGARQEAMKYWRLYWRETDKTLAAGYKKRAVDWLNLGNFTEQERGDISSAAIGEAETRVEKSTRSFKDKFPQETK